MSTEISELIDALRDGTMTLSQVAEQFRHRSWPRRTTPLPTTYLELAADTQQDSEAYVPNSFDDVVAAYDLGRVTDEEYAVLSAAVAESKRAEDERKDGGSSGLA
jgi:hypothetical protein